MKRILMMIKKTSVWLTTLTVSILVLLLALTINNAREGGVVDQFSRQQLAIAKGMASGVDDAIISVEKSMVVLSRLPNISQGHPEITMKNMKVIYDDLEGRVRVIIRLDEKGNVLMIYPKSDKEFVSDLSLKDQPSFREIANRQKAYVGDMPLPVTSPDHTRRPTIVIGVPQFNEQNHFCGAILALFSMTAELDRLVKPVEGSLPSFYWILDDTGTFIVHPDPTWIGRNITSLYGKADPAIKKMGQILRSGKEGTGEIRLRMRTGSMKKHIVVFAPFPIGAKKWFAAVVTPYDVVVSLIRRTFINIVLGAASLIIVVFITSMSIAQASRRRLKLTEEIKRLKERESWQEKLIREKVTIDGIVDGSPIPMFVIDLDHKVTVWNKACADLTGYDTKEMIGTDHHYLPFYGRKRPVIADLIVDHDFESLEKYYGGKKVRKSTRVEGAYEARDFYENLGGRTRHLYFLAAPIFDEKGAIIAAVETLQDVSREEQMSQNLREYAETLQNELDENIRLRKEIEQVHSYIQSVVESLPDKIYEVEADGTIRLVNPGMHGEEDTSEIDEKQIFEVVSPIPGDVAYARWKDDEIEMKTTDGQKRNFLITTRPIKGTDRYIIVQRDITDFKNLEEKFYDSQKLAAVGQLSAGIAHEIRNPLSSIKMSLQILEKRMQPEGNDLQRFKIAQREVEHLENLVNDVLIYARPIDPKKEPFDITKVFEIALAMTEQQILEKKIQVESRFPSNLPLVAADAAMLEQAFQNIYRNAVESMEMNGKLIIQADAVNNGKAIRIEIIDNGSGINSEDMPHLFNPFFTKKKYGTGLGLTQVKKIVDMHHGTVEISSKKGEGTHVIITLPIDRGHKT
ncbi:MAG: ATP-binding protein [Syntrophales bacterium]